MFLYRTSRPPRYPGAQIMINHKLNPRKAFRFKLWKLAMLLQAYLGLKDRREVEVEIRLAKLETEFNALFAEVLSELPRTSPNIQNSESKRVSVRNK